MTVDNSLKHNHSKVLVLGGNGFLGKSVVHALNLSDTDYQITVVTRNKQKNLSVNYLECDLLDATVDFVDLLSGYDVVINCVGELKDESLMEAKNFGLVEKVVVALIKLDRPAHLIHISSVGCYGAVENSNGKVLTIKEDAIEEPSNLYEKTKKKADDYIRALDIENGSVSYTILRPTIIYGPGMPNESLRNLGNFVRSKKFFFIGDKKAIANYIHVDDVALAVSLAIEHPIAKGRVYIVSDDTTQLELICSFANYFGVKVPRLVIPKSVVIFCLSVINTLGVPFPLNNSRVDYLTSKVFFSHEKISKELGFKAQKTIKNDLGKIYS
ncbi:NAD-dependent epimerase/dehydratase family protein [Thiomicrorhabdus sediminis]|uniref:NAD(P)-dependent oxidoreductase n=1 Tax=Thiomicrorhabdus sediminis TaxID=2580412 RepID=A0A4P9K5N5_9GAMM|nr:NAD(P)-dependent oxidoreductase [Thiomicrorhabdus sediminis]QCU89567.1 NAD(P)-dependent oxidoreductase [Thiomicrorhabdus sediminis]